MNRTLKPFVAAAATAAIAVLAAGCGGSAYSPGAYGSPAKTSAPSTVGVAGVGGRPSEAMLAVQPQSPGLADRLWWGSGSRETAVWAGEQGLNLMSSTLLLEDTQVPFDQL